MSYDGRFRRGFGRLRAEMLTQVVHASARINTQETSITQAVSDHVMAPLRKETILARITSFSEMLTDPDDDQSEPLPNRWEYAWQEVEITSTGVGVMSNGLSSTQDDQRRAWNLCEMDNDGSDIEGPGWDLSTAPGTFDIQPIQQCCVVMYSHIDEEGEQRWVFQMANVLDGQCSDDEEEEDE